MRKAIILLACILGIALATDNKNYGFYRTGTQGDWSRCNGDYNSKDNVNKLACIKDKLFCKLYNCGYYYGSSGKSFTIGCPYDDYGYKQTWTNTKSLSDYLPQICSPRVLSQNWKDVGKFVTLKYPYYDFETSVGGILGGELATLKLNLDFDYYYPDFAPNYYNLKDLRICTKYYPPYYSNNDDHYDDDDSYYNNNQNYQSNNKLVKENCNDDAKKWDSSSEWYCSYKFDDMTVEQVYDIGNRIYGGCCYEYDKYNKKYDKCYGVDKWEVTRCIKYINHAFNGGKNLSNISNNPFRESKSCYNDKY